MCRQRHWDHGASDGGRDAKIASVIANRNHSYSPDGGECYQCRERCG
jgi:hypothetical protein